HYAILFTDPPPAAPHPLSLHDALPIFICSPKTASEPVIGPAAPILTCANAGTAARATAATASVPKILLIEVSLISPPHGREADRSEEHTSELQSLAYIVCRLLLEKNKRGLGDCCWVFSWGDDLRMLWPAPRSFIRAELARSRGTVLTGHEPSSICVGHWLLLWVFV